MQSGDFFLKGPEESSGWTPLEEERLDDSFKGLKVDGFQDAGPASRTFELFPGAWGAFNRGATSKAALVDYEIQNGPVCFWYCLCGEVNNQFSPQKGKRAGVTLDQGQCALSWLGNARGRIEPVSKGEICSLSLHLSPGHLARFLGAEEFDRIPRLLTTLLDQADPRAFTLAMARTREMDMVLNRILNCPFQGSLGRRYMESKATELLCLHLAQLQVSQIKKAPAGLNSRDQEKIRAAREILLARMQNPPGLKELAHLVGTNEFKLKKGFNQVFGSTVFGLLHEKRMQMAREMLLDGRVNVSQAAWEVGYTNVSHFITAFRKCFGVTPGDLLK